MVVLVPRKQSSSRKALVTIIVIAAALLGYYAVGGRFDRSILDSPIFNGVAELFIPEGPAQTIPRPIAGLFVLDGDTISTKADGHIRLVGFNAPESDPMQAICPAEMALGTRAKNRLRQIVAGGHLTLGLVSCGCELGTDGTPVCNYGRKCGMLNSRGRDVGEILISEGLAVPYECSREHCPARPRAHWCG